ncbi:bifunctional YncE family protein/alkaline phosphatase family protein [uncultured Mucilaginibacter sp.]|uniref:bifunctional YncE family protein/alkaline phosphatase family protein n=1 Tax=uncultured Mucilaginibacter sp. TaxID=797541 RepID=UPI0025CE8368|nr:bifunctional YncE family protein/alkaline phosphatase family protein [uncultured Mucilaginibacter sp.]
MKKNICSAIILLALASTSFAQLPGKVATTKQTLLPNGWKLSPAGRSLQLGDLPLNMQLSASGKLLAVTNNGESTQSVQLIDPKNEKLLDEKIVGKSWYGLAFSYDEKKVYVSGGNDNWILILDVNGTKFGKADTIKLGDVWPKGKICPTGMAVNKQGDKLYTVTKEDSLLYVINPQSKQVLQKVKLTGEAYACTLSPDEKTLYISVWGDDKVAIYNTASGKLTESIGTQSHPNELLLNKKGTWLFVANANDNSVSVINTKTKKVVETISTTLYPTKLTGSTTNGLALSADEKTLYIANADNNCLAVFDVSAPGSSHSKGFIPVGWYPTNVKTLGSKILVANGKGFESMANPKGPQPRVRNDDGSYRSAPIPRKDQQYIGGLFKGTLSFINTPSATQLKAYTKQVYANTPFSTAKTITADGLAGNPIPRKKGDKSPIKYVFYIIKENRTYDQVLGDMTKGNGDTSLCIFGSKVTPNLHAIANEFVLLDNFYVDAEVSADGHNWSTAAYATDFTEKTWPTSYGGRGGNYDFEGTRKVAYPRDGFIWDYCQRAGVSYRTYGEFEEDGKGTLKSLEGHVCPQSPGFDLNITDQYREKVWAHDLDSLIAKNAVPHLSTIRISNDHTSGQARGKIAPDAAVADNDLGVGLLIEHLSKSPIWKESVVFVLEDDAQNGPDHIDAHRSPVFVAGAYVKRNAVIHNMYSTSGVMRTIELILGLPPMSQYDAAATPLFACFNNKPDMTPYVMKAPQIDLNKRNVAVNTSSKRSEMFNLAKEDAVPDRDLNEVIWKYMKGEDAVLPAPKRSAFIVPIKKNKDTD